MGGGGKKLKDRLTFCRVQDLVTNHYYSLLKPLPSVDYSIEQPPCSTVEPWPIYQTPAQSFCINQTKKRLCTMCYVCMLTVQRHRDNMPARASQPSGQVSREAALQKDLSPMVPTEPFLHHTSTVKFMSMARWAHTHARTHAHTHKHFER